MRLQQNAGPYVMPSYANLQTWELRTEVASMPWCYDGERCRIVSVVRGYRYGFYMPACIIADEPSD